MYRANKSVLPCVVHVGHLDSTKDVIYASFTFLTSMIRHFSKPGHSKTEVLLMSSYPLTVNKQAHYTNTVTSSQVTIIGLANEMQHDRVSVRYPM